MNNQNAKKERKFIGIKDLILGVMLSGIVIVIFFGISPLVQPLGIYLSSILAGTIPAFIGATLYVLLTTKSPRIGTHFVFSLPFMIMFIVMGNMITSTMYFVAAIIGELLMIGGWGKKWRPVVPYTLLWLVTAFGSTVPMVFFPEYTVQIFTAGGLDEATAKATLDAFLPIYTDPVFIGVSIITILAASGLGYYVGVKALHKHFKGAGVA